MDFSPSFYCAPQQEKARRRNGLRAFDWWLKPQSGGQYRGRIAEIERQAVGDLLIDDLAAMYVQTVA